MIFSYNWLQSFFYKKLPNPKKLAEILTMHSFETEKKGKIGKDTILDIDILTNRGADCFSHIGIAREIGALINAKIKTAGQKSKPLVKNQKLNIKDFLSIEVQDKTACSRYTARMIIDVKVEQSPKWMRERLMACGLRPINNIVDAVNYVMLETGQPLHVFDFEKIEPVNSKSQKRKIIVRKAKKWEKIITLNNEEYELDDNILIIADNKEPLAIAGIKGGSKAEINYQTKNIILESANFDYSVIRKASKKLGLKTDASWRFEHNLDANLTKPAVDRAVSLIQEITRGQAIKEAIDYYPKKIIQKKIKLDLDYVQRLLGIKITKKEILKIFNGLGFKITKTPANIDNFLIVDVPSFRKDIAIQEDLIEEIGRIYGYDNIKPVIPSALLIFSDKNENIFWENKTKDIMKQIGFSEIYNYSFINEKNAEIFKKNENFIEVENPVSIEQKYLRPSLIPGLLKNIKHNFKRCEILKIFEIGKIFVKNPKLKENTMLSGVITTNKEKQGFYELKGIIDVMLNKLGISDIWYDDYQAEPKYTELAIWQTGRCAEIKVNKKKIGFLGEISSDILQNLEIIVKPIVFDIDFEALIKECSEEQIYRPVSRYPSAVRDLAILVPSEIKVIDVLNKIHSVEHKIISDIDLFDIYENKELPDGKKSFAFHIIYQAKDRTLLNQEIDAIQKKIIEALEQDSLWEVRK